MICWQCRRWIQGRGAVCPACGAMLPPPPPRDRSTRNTILLTVGVILMLPVAVALFARIMGDRPKDLGQYHVGGSIPVATEIRRSDEPFTAAVPFCMPTAAGVWTAKRLWENGEHHKLVEWVVASNGWAVVDEKVTLVSLDSSTARVKTSKGECYIPASAVR